jgi:low temperature requirement protein LtrA
MSQIRVRMTARATDEPHRASSQLELLFDLTFVVAIARITAPVADSIARGEGLDALTPFLQVFFLIWWAWMNFTWFASSYDTDDVAYRVLTFLQMAGALVLAAGVPAALNSNDYLVITVGYLIMRVGLIALWLRAAIEDPTSRNTALRYAAGVAGLGLAWVLRLVFAGAGTRSHALLLAVFICVVVLELSLPLWLERKRRASWHPHHIAERYGLFAILLLGEGIFAASSKIGTAVDGGGVSPSLVTIAAAGLVVIFALWWLYFLEPVGPGLAHNRNRAFLWGCFGQYGVFATLAGLAAGLEVAIAQTGNQTRLSSIAVTYAVAIPVGVFLMLLWAVSAVVGRLVIRPVVILSGVAVILLVPLSAERIGVVAAIGAIAAVCASMVAATILMEQKAEVDVVGSPTVPADGPLGPRLCVFQTRPKVLFRGHCDSTATCLALSGEAHVVPR